MNYFVTVDGLEVASNLTKLQAISLAKKECKEEKNALCIGIGKIKYKKGKRLYSLLPAFLYY